MPAGSEATSSRVSTAGTITVIIYRDAREILGAERDVFPSHRLRSDYRAFDPAGRVVFTFALIGRFGGRMGVRVGAGREAAGRDRAGAVAGRAPVSLSESASSCRIISAFSHFSGRLRFRLPSGVSRNRAAVASATKAIMTVGDMPNMFRLPWTSGEVDASG
jgi:hypothetical protein